MSFKKDLRLLLKPYYLINILLSVSYIFSKRIAIVCNYMFAEEDCELNGGDGDSVFLGDRHYDKDKKDRQCDYDKLSHIQFCIHKSSKFDLMVLRGYCNNKKIMHCVVNWNAVCGLILPEPTYQGPENIVYLHGANGLQEEFQRDTRVIWLVAFYTAWNPACVTFAPIFSELSAEYALENFKFGKVDVGRYPDAAAKYHVSDASTSKQLPTLILFKNGKEIERRPYADHKGKLVKFLFSIDNVKAAFDLNNIYSDCKKNPIKRKEKKSLKAE